MDFIPEDEAFKFIDDSSFIEVFNLLKIGLSSINPKLQVASDIPPEFGYLPTQNSETQNYLKKINKWTNDHQMLLNPKKSKYMIINFCNSMQFKTRLYIDNSMIEQVAQTRLLGVIISDDLSWNANTREIAKKAFKRMIILRKLNEFNVSTSDMITIYILYIRAIVEQSSVVWSSSITQDEQDLLERTQKVALKIIYQGNYQSYENALQVSKLPTLKVRYNNLLQQFAIKCVKNELTNHMIPLAKQNYWARNQEEFQVPFSRKQSFFQIKHTNNVQ